MSIPSIQDSVLAYFRSFDLAAIARTRDGRLVATRDPAGYSQAPGEATAEERDVQMLPLPHEPRDPVFWVRVFNLLAAIFNFFR